MGMYRELQVLSNQPDKAKRRHFKFYQLTATAVKERVDAFNSIEEAVSVKLAALPNPKTKEAMDQAAEQWFQKLVDDSTKTKSMLQSVKEGFVKGTKVFNQLRTLPDSVMDAITGDACGRPTKRARKE